MDKNQRRRQNYQLLPLLGDYQPLLQNNQNAAAAAGGRRRNNQNNAGAAQGPRGRPQANPNREKKPRRKAFKYTFAAQGGAGGQEEYTVLTVNYSILLKIST